MALGIGLMVLAALLIIAEAHAASGGLLGLLGLAALVAGFIVLDQDQSAGFAIGAIVVTLAITIPVTIVVARKTIAAQRSKPVRTGWEEMIGQVVEVRESLAPEGQVFAQGALWRARVADGAEPAPLGSRVRVESVDGLTSVVVPASESERA